MKKVPLAILIILSLSLPSFAIDKNWIPDDVYEAAQRLFVAQMETYPEVMLKEDGYCSRSEALASTVANPVQLILGRYDLYEPGVPLENLLIPLNRYEFEIRSGGGSGLVTDI